MGITHTFSQNYDENIFRSEPHFFWVSREDLDIHRIFGYASKTSSSQNPIVMQSAETLSVVTHIDWDVYTKDFTRQQYLNFLDQLATYDIVYFIDRSEIKDGMMKMYPVKELKSRF